MFNGIQNYYHYYSIPEGLLHSEITILSQDLLDLIVSVHDHFSFVYTWRKR